MGANQLTATLGVRPYETGAVFSLHAAPTGWFWAIDRSLDHDDPNALGKAFAAMCDRPVFTGAGGMVVKPS